MSNDVKVGAWGGDGGSGEWEFPFSGNSSLSKIHVVSNGLCIYSLAFTSYSQTGGQRNSKKYGGVGMKDGTLETIQLGYGELISEIKGTFGDYNGVTIITSLTFKGARTYGPYGKETGTAFSLTVANGKITGFWGNSEKYLDSFGVLLAV